MRRQLLILFTIFAALLPAHAAERTVPPMFGFKAAYLHKFYRGHHNDGGWSNLDCFGQPGGMSGLHFGLTVEPYFGRGWSLSTGVYYEYFRHRNHITRWQAHEHILYVPAHAKFSYPVGRGVSVYALAGPGISWGMNIKLSRHTNEKDIEPHFDTAGWPRRLQLLAEGGIGVSWRKVGLEVLYGVGLLPEDSMPQGLYSVIRQQKLTVQLEVKF